MKKALIFGITGQDGSYLAELLLEKGYEVYGVIRRSSSFNTGRLEHIFNQITLRYGDVTDPSSVINIISEIKPDEIYNLSAQSHVKVSFEMPYYTGMVDALGTMSILEAVRTHCPSARFYQASTSELYGGMEYNRPETGYTEDSPFHPRSPYGVAKIYGFWAVKNYREAYGLYACNGILFNHESPIRGENFVTRKITLSVAKIALGLQTVVYLGNLDAKRDWGHAKDYVEGMWLMLQQSEPEDYVLATGVTTTVRDFVHKAFLVLGILIEFKGTAESEYAYVKKCLGKYQLNEGSIVVKVSPKYFRPSEVDLLVGDSSKARMKLSWTPKISLDDMIKEMVYADLNLFSHSIKV
jgi:GDPmannose 4,6-dehydratase